MQSIGRKRLIPYVTCFLAFAGAAARAGFAMQGRADAGIIAWMLAFYMLLLLVEPWLISKSLIFLHIINIIQTIIGLILISGSDLDYFSLLFIPPCIQSILNFPRDIAFLSIGVVTALMWVAQLRNFPFSESIGFVISYAAGIFLVTGFSYFALQAEQAQNRSEALLADLQMANRKLQAYAAQVQELAAAEERNRLARELHDSVTQVIFGLTLSAQAARILITRDPARAAAELDHIQVLAQNALAEMRALIQQLHPRSIAEEGLVSGLRRLAAERQANDGLVVELKVSGEQRLPVKFEEALFRFAQEALQNIAKHAHTDSAVITLDLDDGNRVCMGIEDAGVGFEPAQARSLPGHLGLTSMSERIQALGGTLIIDSKPGKGTRLKVELDLVQEVEHA